MNVINWLTRRSPERPLVLASPAVSETNASGRAEAAAQHSGMADAGAGMTTVEFTRRLLIVAAFLVFGAFLYAALSILLILFGSILLAVVLSSAANALHRWTRLPRGAALAITVLLLISGGALIAVLFGSRLIVQGSELYRDLPGNLEKVRAYLVSYELGQRLMDELQTANLSSQGSSVLSHVVGAVNSALGVVTDCLLIFFAGLYLAAQPDMYRRGLLSLLPKRHRRRGAQVLEALYDNLRHWLMGQLVSMVVVGACFAVALSWIGVPSAMVLGLIAALAEFVPLVGPVLATIPAMLGAMTLGPATVLWVVIAFLVIQQAESNLLVPFVQRRTVDLPPVIGLFATVVFALLFGPIGLVFAVPLVVAVMVLIEKIYVDDILGGPVADSNG